MTKPQPDVAPGLETDDRFPSGPWTGFFLEPTRPGRHTMDLRITFRDGEIRGEGRDRVGEFVMKGRYELVDGKCWWTKSYLRKHSLAYRGFNEGKGIWGTWEMGSTHRGGFQIWPEGMSDPTQARLAEAIEVPAEAPVPVPPAELIPLEPLGEPVSSELGEPMGGPIVPDGWA